MEITDSRGNIENSGHRRGFYGISGKILNNMGEHAGEGDEGVCICSVLLMEVRLLLSHRNWEIGALFPLVIAFQSGDSQDLEKDIFLVVTGEESRRRFTSQRDRGRIYNHKFS